MIFKTNVGSINYNVFGNENSTPIVFLHGVAMDHKTFLSQKEALLNNYKIILIDYPYHGDSSSMDRNLSFTPTVVKIIIELLDYLSIKQAIFVGQSLGSLVSQVLEDNYSERVLATIHIGGNSLFPKYPSFVKIFKPMMNFILLMSTNSVAKTFAKHKAIKEDTINYLEETVMKTGKKTIIHLTKEMVDDMVKGLKKPTDKPMLIMYGEHEVNFIKKRSNKWHKRNINNNVTSKIAVIKDAHHIANQDNPNEVNKAIKEFLLELYL